jgi:N-acetylmuramoyl-L-alanine amidase
MLKRITGSILGLWIACLSTEAVCAASLDYWRFNARLSRLELVTESDVRPVVRLLGNPARLVVDLPGVALGRPRTSKSIGSFVEQVRVGQFDRRTTRLVIQLGSQYTLQPEAVRVRGLAPNRWFVQLPPLEARGDQLPLPETGVPIAVPEPQPYPRARAVIALDPGHGGPDPGAIGIGGVQEKQIVLDISLKVARQLESQGIQVVLTRSDDRDLDLAPRVAIAEQARARIFVSIHANAISMSQPGVNGLETYYYNNGFQLARTIHNAILSRISIRDRGVRQARFYVLRKTSMPAVLVETGFVTGREDGPNLARPTFRTRMAEAIAAGILQYFR